MSEWVGSLADLMAMIEAEAIPACIVVLAPGAGDTHAGEIHLLAGGLSDAFAGSLRRDDAVAALRRIEGARLLVETRLPDPDSGSLATPAHDIGSLADRPLTVLMRYCEDYVLTGKLQVRRGAEQATLQYRKGELVGTVVNGSEDPEGLPSVLAWTEGDYIIQLPKIPGTRPQSTSGERKRHSTLPMSVAEPPLPAPVAPRPAEARPPMERTAVYSSHVPVTRTAPPTPPRVMDVGVGTPPPLYPPLPSPGTGTAPPLPGMPSPSIPAKPAISTRPAAPSVPPVVPPAKPKAPVAPPVAAKAAPAKPAPAKPAPAKAAPAKAAPAKPRPGKPPIEPTSNDLKPASGTIEGRPVARNQIPVPAAPVEVAPPTPKPIMLPAPMGQVTPPVVRVSPMSEGRRRSRGRKFGEGRHLMRKYILIGVAVGVGVLVAYWAYWYFPSGR